MKSELHRLVRDLRTYVEWQRRGLSAAGAPPANPDDRAAFDEQQSKRRVRKMTAMAASLRDAPSPPTTGAPNRAAARPAPTLTPVARPSDTRPPESATAPPAPPTRELTPKPKPTPTPAAADDKLWLKLGSKPKSTFGSAPDSSSAPTQAERAFDPTDTSLSNAEKLQKVQALLGDCKRCGLCQTRNKLVFGTGNADARLMFIGEAPGSHEDQQGQPFVGESGELLNKMIVAMGFKRDDVYLANLLKCHPPENRDPANLEIQTCSPFLMQQIDAIQPDVIVTLGRFATDSLLRDAEAPPARGQWQDFKGVPVMPTFHPAYLLEHPEHKRDAWAHLQAVMARLNK